MSWKMKKTGDPALRDRERTYIQRGESAGGGNGVKTLCPAPASGENFVKWNGPI